MKIDGRTIYVDDLGTIRAYKVIRSEKWQSGMIKAVVRDADGVAHDLLLNNAQLRKAKVRPTPTLCS